MILRTVLCAALFVMVPKGWAESNEVRELLWDDLIPAELNFDDPFEKLTEEQLYSLALVAQYREKQASTSSPKDGVNADYEEALVSLKEGNIDIDGLLARRAEITEKRRLQAVTTNDELDGKHIRIPGFLLPLEYSENKKVVEFLLVPWVGACIHTPPPPPNQIVHVKLDKGFEVESMYTAVRVSGNIAIENNSPALNYVDGVKNINVGYAITSANVTLYGD